jgi:hypothetical protein
MLLWSVFLCDLRDMLSLTEMCVHIGTSSYCTLDVAQGLAYLGNEDQVTKVFGYLST